MANEAAEQLGDDALVETKEQEAEPSRFDTLSLDTIKDGSTPEQRAAKDYTPTDEDLKTTVDEAYALHADLSLPKLLAKVKAYQPHWKLSEKRLRQYLKTRPPTPKPDKLPTPTSKHDARLIDLVKAAAPRLEIKRIDQMRGRGLFAKEDIEEGAVVLEEDAWVFAPTDFVRQRVTDGIACAHCGKVYQSGRPTYLTCTFHSPKAGLSDPSHPCKITFCSKTCQSSHTTAYAAFTCPHSNHEYAELIDWCTETQVPIAIYLIAARIAVANTRSEKEGREEMLRADAFTAISEKTRREATMSPEEIELQFETVWRQAFEKVLKALHLPSADPSDAKTIEAPPADAKAQAETLPEKSAADAPKANGAKKSKPKSDGSSTSVSHARPLTAALTKALLTYEGFLYMWGRVSLNQEDDGGLYSVHSALNHSCVPNAILRRHGQKKRTPGQTPSTLSGDPRPSRIFIHVGTDLPAGSEILLTYVDPRTSHSARREMLKKEYLFLCSCPRCDEERSTTRRMERLIHQISGMSTARVSDGPNGLTIINVDQDGDEDGAREGEEGTEMSEELLKALSGATKANNEAAPKIEEIAK